MTTSNPARAGSLLGFPTKLLGLSLVLAASACSAPAATTEPIPVPSASTVEQSAEEVDVALSEVSRQISSQLTGDEEDLALAWSDFEGDVRSVVSDLIGRPSRVDIEGMQQRIDSLGALLDGSALELPEAQWDDFVSAFQTLINETFAADNSA
jgi:hypothetical protein